MRFASRKLRNIELKTSLFFRHSREAMLRTTFDTEQQKKSRKKYPNKNSKMTKIIDL